MLGKKAQHIELKLMSVNAALFLFPGEKTILQQNRHKKPLSGVNKYITFIGLSDDEEK